MLRAKKGQDDKVLVATCTSANGKPPSVVSWETRLKGEAEYQEIRNPNGTVTVISRYRLVPSREAHQQSLACIVNYHMDRFRESLTLNVQCEPGLLVWAPLSPPPYPYQPSFLICFSSPVTLPAPSFSHPPSPSSSLSPSGGHSSSPPPSPPFAHSLSSFLIPFAASVLRVCDRHPPSHLPSLLAVFMSLPLPSLPYLRLPHPKSCSPDLTLFKHPPLPHR